MRIWLVIITFFFHSSFGITAEKEKDSLDFLDKIEYPELQVVPRASERLESEAQFEREGGSWLYQWSFLLTGATTLLGATMTHSSTANLTADQANMIKLGQIVGGLTLSTGIYFGAVRPYDSNMDKLRKIKGKDKRSLLLKERMSEEIMDKTAQMIGNISKITVLSNLLVNAFLSEQSYGNDSSRVFVYSALLMSSLSMMFANPYIMNWDKHREYKNKIYSPLPQTSFHIDPQSGKAVSYVGLYWQW